MIFSIFIIIFIQSSFVEAVMPEYLPVNRAVSRNDAIENYFTLGFTASEILSFFLNVHGIQLRVPEGVIYLIDLPSCPPSSIDVT